MLKFNTTQNIYDIAKVKVGGQPGELPTFLVGSIFWLGQKMVQDPNKGLFDSQAAEQIINTMQTQSDITGVPYGLDVVLTTLQRQKKSEGTYEGGHIDAGDEIVFSKYIDFVASHCEAPIMLDAMSPKTRMEAAKLVHEMGLQDRCFYNSVYKGVTDAELANLKDSGIKMSIVLADNPKDNSLEGKMVVIEEALALANKGGITKPLIDTAIPAFAPDMGTAVRTIPIMKEKYGHPVGLGSGNVVTTMGWVKANVAKEFRPGCRTATNAIMQTMGANWLMIGPAEQAEWVFPAVAVVDSYVASAAADLGTRPLEETHPIYKMFL